MSRVSIILLILHYIKNSLKMNRRKSWPASGPLASYLLVHATLKHER